LKQLHWVLLIWQVYRLDIGHLLKRFHSQWKVAGRFSPNMSAENKTTKINHWQKAVRAVLAWSK